MLPRIKISFENGALGQVPASADGVLGILCTGTAVASTFQLATPYTLRSYDSLLALGVTEANNPSLVKIIKEFYDEAGTGTEVWIMAFPDTVKLSDMVATTDTAKAKALINAANGRIQGLILSRSPGVGYTPTITDGLDADVALARANAQLLSQWAADEKYAPLFVMIEGYAYSGIATDLADLTTGDDNMVGIFLGDTVSNSNNAAMGIIAGRIAKNPVHQNIGAVLDGSVAALKTYLKATPVELADIESIHNKGYITFRTYVGRSGYFFNDDTLATLPTDDYSHLTARRTINKAYRIAYDALLPKLLSAVPINSDGTMQAPLIKSWQADVERAIASRMTANGELSADISKPNDKGVECYIDASQNVVATSRVEVVVRVRPFGYPRYIDVPLGFQVIGA